MIIILILLFLTFGFQSSHAAQQTSAPLTPSLTESYQTDLMTGAAVVNVPITVPPGRKGIQPNLALSYSSSNSNGICGVGWQLDLGSIQRNTKRGVPKYDGSDSFVASINGASIELVDIGNGEYRAKQEGAFMKVSFDGASWQVKDKSGTTYSFGSSDNSRQYNSGHIYRWYLDKVTDVNGNYMTVSYLQDQNQVYPQQIQYTGKVSADAPVNTVEFIYEARNDVSSDFRPTFEVRTGKRLSAIDIKADVDRVRKYILNYSYSADSARSLLMSITQYGSDGITSLPPITFEYQKGGESQ
ncbi:MAG: hypothetical protein HZA14_13405 [Nitrospirae bacterium]|nr:hypothetical protein [Nitrospirota bacterium]